ncbi:MAG TPA: hypothetical protein PLU52_04640 [Opitutaceae bacterium]|nr:hypothetical protein [Opitutaceae bacterium]HND61657.1 hypothetical protein [Opitutaceae bacterium]
MHTKLNDWKNGWFGIELSLKPDEIDQVISLLQLLKRDPDQHFHLSSDGKGAGGVGDIEVSVQAPSKPSNMITMGEAIPPGGNIPDPS